MKKVWKKVLLFFAMLAILACSWYMVWGDDIVLIGIFAIIFHVWKDCRFLGWVAALTYPVTYWTADILDAPFMGVYPNNLYVYWYFSYTIIVLASLVVDLIVKKKRGV